MVLDGDAVAEVAKFDGYAGIITNSTQDISVILEHYHGLWADELMRTEISVLTHVKTHKKYAMPSKIRAKAQKLYMIVGKKLKNTPYFID